MNNIKIYQSETTIDPIICNNQHESRSKNYQFQSSKLLVDQMENNGFTLKGTSFGQVRDKTKSGYQKHMMIFERPDLKIDDNNNLQVLITNSHDGSNCLTLNLGIFRVICANGLVIGDNLCEFKVKHQGNDFYEEVNENMYKIVAMAPEYAKQIRAMQQIELSTGQKLCLAQKIANLRLNKYCFVNLNRMLEPNRKGDVKSDLWTITNVLQEKAIRGGIEFTQARKTKTGNTLSICTSQAIKSFQSKTELNKTIWNESIKLLAA